MNYLDLLIVSSENTQKRIEGILEKYNVQPVGTGYIDLITLNDYIEDLIKELTEENILIAGVTWWCHFTEDSKLKLGCPHGMGGPKSNYYEGWFSETQIPMFNINESELENIDISILKNEVKLMNDCIRNYIKNEFIQTTDYLECLVPALWLYVPTEWNRLFYQVHK